MFGIQQTLLSMVLRQCLYNAPVWGRGQVKGNHHPEGNVLLDDSNLLTLGFEALIDLKLWLIVLFNNGSSLSTKAICTICRLKDWSPTVLHFCNFVKVFTYKTWSPLQPLMQAYTKQLFHLGSISMSYLSNVIFNQCDGAFSDKFFLFILWKSYQFFHCNLLWEQIMSGNKACKS